MFHASVGGELFFRWGGTSFLSEGGAPWGGGGGFEKNHKMGGRGEVAPPLWETLIPGGNFGT